MNVLNFETKKQILSIKLARLYIFPSARFCFDNIRISLHLSIGQHYFLFSKWGASSDFENMPSQAIHQPKASLIKVVNIC